MLHAPDLRTTNVALVLGATAAGVLVLGAGWPVALVCVIGGTAAVLIAIGTAEPTDEAADRQATGRTPPRGAPTGVGPPGWSAERGLIDFRSAKPLPTIDEVVEAIAEPVLIVAEGRISHANGAARKLLGDHILGEDVRLAIRHPGAAQRLASAAGAPQGPVDLVGLGALDQRWQMRVSRAAGGPRIVHLVDQTGNYAAERMRVDFVANASHELRTPLASILGYIETLGEGPAGEDAKTRGRFLRIMFDEARRMQRLIEDLISLSRIEADKYRLPDRAVDLGALIGEVCREVSDAGAIGAASIAIDAGAVAPVAGDRVQLSQMLHNLIGNAVKYGKAGTAVAIRLWQDPAGMVRISVTDEGDGIASEHLPRLTERFYRVDAGRSRAAGGTGLGLSIVKHIVERHRGRLDIASQVGKGTIVTVMLPAYAPIDATP